MNKHEEYVAYNTRKMSQIFHFETRVIFLLIKFLNNWISQAVNRTNGE